MMKIKNLVSIAVFCLFTGQFIYAQTNYVGNLNLSKKGFNFILTSPADTINVAIDKKNIEFTNGKEFQLHKVKNRNYNLIAAGDTIAISEDKKQLILSSGEAYTIVKKKAHQLTLKDGDGTTVLDASYKMKRNRADYSIQIAECGSEVELLSYATRFLYEKSFNEANSVPYMYFVF